jgi:hypothetical protein
MGQQFARCSVCSHPARVAIERALKKAESLKFVAERYGFTHDQLGVHKNQHMLRNVPAVIEDNQKNAATVIHNKMDPVVLFEEHDECILEAKRLITYCLGERARNGEWIRDPDTRGWALGIREWRGCLDQKNKMMGLYDQVDPRLQRAFAARIIQVVSMALEAFPEAKTRVLQAIDQVESGDG